METLKGEINLSNTNSILKKQQRKLLIKRFFLNKPLVIGGSIFVFLVLFATFSPLLVLHNPYDVNVSIRLQAPNAEHILGTDDLGRDLYSRIAHGAQATIKVGFLVAALSTVFGVIIGLYASYYRFLDQILMRICDGLMSIPSILLAIALMAAFGASIQNVIIALTIVFTPYMARVIRSAGLVVREQTYIEAMRAQGASTMRIILKHMLPNTISPLVVQGTLVFAEAIIIEAALSFLGAGVPAPEPSWGNILYDGKLVIYQAWWMTVFPGIMVALSILSLNLLGDGFRDLIDPHTSGKK